MTMCAYPSQVQEKLITETVPPRTKDERISAATSLSKQLTPCAGPSSPYVAANPDEEAALDDDEELAAARAERALALHRNDQRAARYSCSVSDHEQ